MPRPLHLAWALALGACFTGQFLAGQPCSADADCGPSLRCEAGVCGGPSGQASSSSATATTELPTTSAATTSTSIASTSTSTSSTGSSSSSLASTGAGTTGEACGIGRCKDIDLLFVVDNSPSMASKGQILLSALLAFGDEVAPTLRSACSVHLGLVTTDKYPHNPPECQELGALVQSDNSGKACPFVEGKPFATLPDLDNPPTLGCILGVGSDGDHDERPIDALFGVFNPDLNLGCNAGFYRPDAFFAVVLATDEDDDDNDLQGHSGSTSFDDALWPSVFSNFKGSVDDLYILGLLGDPDPMQTSCPWMPLASDDGLGAESSPSLRGFIESFPEEHRAIGSLCRAPDPKVYAPLMQEILGDIQIACGA